MSRAVSLLLVLGLAAACRSGDGGVPADAGLDGDGSSDARAPDASTPEDLGEACSAGCDDSLASCVLDSPECAGGCLFVNGALGIDAYCSYACDSTACPAGWTCLPTDDGRGSYCFADPAVCGDGIVGRGEQCDDGEDNGRPGGLCSGQCELSSTSGGEVAFMMDGREQSASGTSDDGSVRARLVNTPDGDALLAAFDLSTGWELSLLVLLDDVAEPLPMTVRSRVTLTIFAGATLCFYSPGQFDLGAVIIIEEREGNRFVGSFDTVVTYDGSCGSSEPSTPPDPTMRPITESSFAVTAVDERD